MTGVHAGRSVLAIVIAAVLLGISGWGIAQTRAGVTVQSANISGVPVHLISAGAEPRPTVIIMHGFAGSSTIMNSLAFPLARAGYTTIHFDADGHGANPRPLAVDDEFALQRTLGTVRTWADTQSTVDPDRVALLGHSMGAIAVVRFGVDSPDAVGATIALSLPSAEQIPIGQATRPPNLLTLVGSLEPANFVTAALDAVDRGYPGTAFDATVGSTADASLRRAQQIPGAEHISIVFRQETLDVARAWLQQTIGGSSVSTPVPNVLVLILLPLIAAGLLLGVLGSVRTPNVQVGARRLRSVVGIATGSAIAASVLAWLSTALHSAIPLAVGGYLAVWFTSAGLVAAVLARIRLPKPDARSVGVGILAAAIATAAFVIPGVFTWTSFAVVGPRWWILLLLLVVFGVYFTADAALTRGRSPGRQFWVMLLLRLILIAILVASIPVLGAPGFLILLLPVMLLLFVVLAGYAALLLRNPGGFWPAVMVQVVPLASLVATVFPLAQ